MCFCFFSSAKVAQDLNFKNSNSIEACKEMQEMQLPPISLLGHAHCGQFGVHSSRISYVWLLKSLVVKSLVSGGKLTQGQIVTLPVICL